MENPLSLILQARSLTTHDLLQGSKTPSCFRLSEETASSLPCSDVAVHRAKDSAMRADNQQMSMKKEAGAWTR